MRSEPEEDELPLEPDREIYAPQPEFVDKVKDKWPEILESIMADVKYVLYSAIENCTLREFEGKLALTFADEGFTEFRDMVAPDMDYLKGLIKRHCGMDVGVAIKCDADFARLPQMKRDDPMEALLGLPITEIE